LDEADLTGSTSPQEVVTRLLRHQEKEKEKKMINKKEKEGEEKEKEKKENDVEKEQKKDWIFAKGWDQTLFPTKSVSPLLQLL